ncbi:Flotillin family [Trema orientale]|uniref:Flotillin-like n=1 Tax=Trema orientale TaxID=63057 RepID=A0A2P5BNZ1_TREOI|nr:Flotillin family [Trema orientale]
MKRHYVARPQEYLAITGLGIKDMKLAKEYYIWPLIQKCTRISVSSITCPIRVEAKSAENIPFILSAIFKMCPPIDDKIALLCYAKFVYSNKNIPNLAYDRIERIIKSEILNVAASMRKDDTFKEEAVYKIQLRLNQFGLIIYDAFFEQVIDVHTSKSWIGDSTLVSKNAKLNGAKNENQVPSNDVEGPASTTNKNLVPAQARSMYQMPVTSNNVNSTVVSVDIQCCNG